MSKTDDLIKAVLVRSKKPLSTYEVAKLAGISWSTVNMHCYKLKSNGIVESKEEEAKTGAKKVVWWLKK